MPTPIEMPKLGNTVEECLLARWLKHAGDPVAEGEPIAEIETDKANYELTSPATGTLLATFFNEGDLVPVFTNVGVVGTPGDDVTQFRQPPPGAAGGPEAGPTPTLPPGSGAASTPSTAAAASSPAPGRATEASASISRPQASALDGQGAAAAEAASAPLSPRARRFAAGHGFLPAPIVGSGPGGRVLEADLQRLYQESARPTPLARRMLAEGYELRTGAPGVVRAADLGPPTKKLSRAREITARRMRQSLDSTAQYTMSTSADATGLLALRSRVKARAAALGLPDININEMVMFCAVRALALRPEVNVELVDGGIRAHEEINIGFACDTPKGLLVPVVRQAGRLSLPDLARRVKELTQKALGGTLSPDDMAGGTFTVSNLGMYGVETFTPILNPPQVAILGVDSITLKPVRRDGAVVFVDHLGLSITCDHQVIDGAPGARFLATVREQVEQIETGAGLEL